MTDDLPLWLREAEAAKARGEQARSRAADERALWIAKGVEEHGRGGRKHAAEALGITIGEVDKALARARGLNRPTGLPDADELLARLYTLEMPPLTNAERRVLEYIARSTPLDVSWLEQPGELLAQEVEDIDPDELPPGVEQAVLVEKCRSWARIQALAVLDAHNAGDTRG